MKDDFIKAYNLDIRFATQSEINDLSEYLAKKKWEDYQKNKKITLTRPTKKETIDFLRKEKAIILELIGDKVLVQDYKKFDVSIFVFNYIQEHDKNTILSMTFRVLQTKRGMESLESGDAIFKLNALKKQPYHKRQHKTGRHDRPKNESIQKTIEIRKYLKVNPRENRDRVCNEFGLSKTTYYRVVKWLEERKN